jgi:hypothetical protein
VKTYVLKKPSGDGAASPAPSTSRVYPDTATQIISAKEVAELGRASSLAFAVHRKEVEAEEPFLAFARRAAGTVDAYQRQWRHLHVKQATAGRAAGLRQVARADFGDVLGHFLNLAGLTAQAFEAMMRGGKANEDARQSGHSVEELIERLARHFAGQVAQKEPSYTPAQCGDAGRARAGAYVAAIEKSRFEGKRWQTLPPWRQCQMHDTLQNRLNAMLGLGKPENRNKRQRAAARTRRAEVAPPPRTAAAPVPARHFVAD